MTADTEIPGSIPGAKNFRNSSGSATGSTQPVRLCGLVVRNSGYSYSSLGFESRSYQIFCIAMVLERGPLSLTASVVYWLDFLATVSEASGSIPVDKRIF